MSRTIKSLALAAPLLLFFVLSCSDSTSPDTGTVTLKFDTAVSGFPLFTNSINYVNAAEQIFSVETLKYFISDIRLWRPGQGGVYTASRMHFVDIANPGSTGTLALADVPEGTYQAITFTFGLSDEDNVTGGLPSELDSMIWPDSLGGGYHYMRLEGKFKNTFEGDTLSHFTNTGRVNTNSYTFSDTLTFAPFTITSSDARWQLNLTMNIEQWFSNPTIYRFPEDDPIIIDDDAIQGILRGNGSTVFSISPPFQN